MHPIAPLWLADYMISQSLAANYEAQQVLRRMRQQWSLESAIQLYRDDASAVLTCLCAAGVPP